MKRLDEIRALEAAATKGPWMADTEVRGDCVVWGPNGRFLMNTQAEPHWLEYPGEKRSVSFDVDRRDAAFIASARNAVPALLGAVDAVLALADEMEQQPPSEIGTIHGIGTILRAVLTTALGGEQ